jgi:hypothetical protein
VYNVCIFTRSAWYANISIAAHSGASGNRIRKHPTALPSTPSGLSGVVGMLTGLFTKSMLSLPIDEHSGFYYSAWAVAGLATGTIATSGLQPEKREKHIRFTW